MSCDGIDMRPVPEFRQDGGAAFPVVHPNEMGVQFFGMSLRDYFAAKAMQGLCANQSWLDNAADRMGNPLMAAAKASFEMADAMLEARK